MEYQPTQKVEIRLPAGWRAGLIKRIIPNYTKSGGTVYEVTGKGFVSITSAATLRRGKDALHAAHKDKLAVMVRTNPAFSREFLNMITA